VTQDGIGRLCIDFFSHYLGTLFEDESEISQYVSQHEDDFFRIVESRALFVAPSAQVGLPTGEALKAYRRDIATWRTETQRDMLDRMPDSSVIVHGIMERLVPQFHLKENAETFLAHPLLGLPQQAHYFSLCGEMYEQRLAARKLLRNETIAVLDALSEQEFGWLGNVPMKALIELRSKNTNSEFRQRLATFVSELYDAELGDVDRVAAEIGRGIAAMIAEHQNEMRRIQEEYKRRYSKTAVAAWTTVAAQFVPLLAPIATFLAVPSAGKYLWDKVDERYEKRKAQQSLTGVIATARRSARIARPKST
jgi:hypothetical protein